MEHTVEAVMTSQVITARPTTPFQELVRLLERHHIGALPVVDDSGRLVGIVSEADLLIKEGYPHGATDASAVDEARYRRRLDKAAGTRAAEVMATPVSTVPLGTLVGDAVRLMLRLDVRRLPVVDARGGLAGIVARSDLLKVFLRPDPAVQWEVDHDVVRGELGIAAGKVQVEVRDAVVRLRGQVQRRGQVAALVRRLQAVDGVVEVDARLLSWRIDDQAPTAVRKGDPHERI
jgi:CBS domain-containing protein